MKTKTRSTNYKKNFLHLIHGGNVLFHKHRTDIYSLYGIIYLDHNDSAIRKMN